MTGLAEAIVVRLATCSDATVISEVQILSWRSTYQGFGIDDFLNNAPLDARAEQWANVLCNPNSERFVYVAEENGQIVGFAAGGPERSGDPEYKGELYALYLLQAVWRRGIGRELLHTVAKRLTQSGISSMLIWVLDVNPARFFYEACGGKAVRQQQIDFGGKTFDEIGYGWLDITTLDRG